MLAEKTLPIATPNWEVVKLLLTNVACTKCTWIWSNSPSDWIQSVVTELTNWMFLNIMCTFPTAIVAFWNKMFSNWMTNVVWNTSAKTVQFVLKTHEFKQMIFIPLENMDHCFGNTRETLPPSSVWVSSSRRTVSIQNNSFDTIVFRTKFRSEHSAWFGWNRQSCSSALLVLSLMAETNTLFGRKWLL